MINSICFSFFPANALNSKAKKIDPRLYLFAYYEPKPFIKEESPRVQFITAVINLYSLLWDCGPFVHKSLLQNSKGRPKENILPDIEWGEKKHMVFRCRGFANIISHFRSIICHNNSEKFPLSREHVEVANGWIRRKCRMNCSYDELTQDDWKTMLNELAVEASRFIMDIDICLDALLNCCGSSRFEIARESWLKAIARNYLTNTDLLLNAMAAFYQLYLENTNSSMTNSYSLRSCTKRWLYEIQEDEYRPQYWLGEANHLESSKVYQLLQNWQAKWEEINPTSIGAPCEAVMPASSFFLVLADDVYRFAQNPNFS